MEDIGKKASSELGCEFVRADVTKKADWEAILKFADEKFGRLDSVVNNAGTTYRNKPTMEVTDEEFDKVFNVNVKSIYYSASVIVPYMQKKGNGGSVSCTLYCTAELTHAVSISLHSSSSSTSPPRQVFDRVAV
jgi:NAD(P)-dependent dehydrogenase (short-subunit alcohol dehydrogenase family)